jgi:hypothetical protein
LGKVRPGFREGDNAGKGTLHFCCKFKSETGALIIIVVNGIGKFLLSTR